MSFELTNVYTEHFPKLRFIGKCYTNEDRIDGGFGVQWGEWWRDGLFDKLTESVSSKPFSEDTIGLMTMRGDMSGFTYWIGMFFLADTIVPEGYEFLDLPESKIGIGWICGSEDNGEIYGGPPHEAVCKALAEIGHGEFRNDVAGEGSDTYCFFERYNCPRFTTKDENGNVTLDYGNYIK